MIGGGIIVVFSRAETASLVKLNSLRSGMKMRLIVFSVDSLVCEIPLTVFWMYKLYSIYAQI